MSEPFVEYPRTTGQRASVVGLKAALRTWETGYRAMAAGVTGLMVTILFAMVFTFVWRSSSYPGPFPPLILALPWLIGHGMATTRTYRAIGEASGFAPSIGGLGAMGAGVCFCLPFVGLVVPLMVREAAHKFLRRNGIVVTSSDVARRYVKALDRHERQQGGAA